MYTFSDREKDAQERVTRRNEIERIRQRTERPASEGSIRQRCLCVVSVERKTRIRWEGAGTLVPEVANVHDGNLVAALSTRKDELCTWYFCAMIAAETKELPNGLRRRSTSSTSMRRS